MKIATIQLEINDSETHEDRINKVDKLISKQNDVDLILLPEIWATGYFNFDKYDEEAESINGPFVQFFSNKAKAMNVCIFAGSFVEREGENLYNTSVLFGSNGEILGTYRKVHLFRYGSKEGELLNGGTEPTVINTPFGKVGLSTCYDLRFPELYRKQIELGAKVLLVTSAWPLARVEHWKLFNQVRALENQSYLISCNCVGNNQGVQLGGHSQVVSPWGVVVAQAGEQEEVLKTEIDPGFVDKIRDEFPQLKHRVFKENCEEVKN